MDLITLTELREIRNPAKAVDPVEVPILINQDYIMKVEPAIIAVGADKEIACNKVYLYGVHGSMASELMIKEDLINERQSTVPDPEPLTLAEIKELLETFRGDKYDKDARQST